MNLVTALERNVGVVITSIAFLTSLAFNVYQFRRSQAMTERLERKEKFERLSNDLRSLHRRITSYCDRYDSPHDHEDLDLFLHDFGRDLITYQNTTDENPTVSTEVSRYRSDDSNILLDGPSEVVDAYRNLDSIPRIQTPLQIEDSNEVLRWTKQEDIDWIAKDIMFVRRELEELRTTHESRLSQFDSTLIEETSDAIDRVIMACYGQIFEHADGVEFDTDQYDTPIELEDDVYETFVLSEDVHDAVRTLSELADRIDRVQTQVFQTSTS